MNQNKMVLYAKKFGVNLAINVVNDYTDIIPIAKAEGAKRYIMIGSVIYAIDLFDLMLLKEKAPGNYFDFIVYSINEILFNAGAFAVVNYFELQDKLYELFPSTPNGVRVATSVLYALIQEVGVVVESSELRLLKRAGTLVYNKILVPTLNKIKSI